MIRFAFNAVKFAAVGLAVLIATVVLLYAALPTPTSPPLADRAGVVLDHDTEAKLIALVFQAARDDDATTVHEFLEEGFDANVRNPRGDTLLIVAAYHDSRAVVQRLLAQPQIDVEARNRMGLTAVAAAAFKGHDDALSALLAHGAQADAANSTNQTPIMFAGLAGKTSSVKLLLAAGADATRADDLGNTARSLAETQGARETADVLASRAPHTGSAGAEGCRVAE